jgi:hypothetical protein
MKPVVLTFVGGYWDGKMLKMDSRDQEESLLAAACYEMTHHGRLGEECVGLSEDAITYARVHGWPTPEEGGLQGNHRYMVTERRETLDQIVITLSEVPPRES